MDSLKLKLRLFSSEPQEFTYRLDGSFFSVAEPIEVRRAVVEVILRARRRDADTVAMEVACSGSLTIPCDRCMGDMVHRVDTTYAFTVSQRGDRYDDNGEGLVTIPATATEIDVEPIVRDTVLLTIPLTHVHDGIREHCDEQMLRVLERHLTDQEPLQAEASAEQEPATDPRWDALKKLKE